MVFGKGWKASAVRDAYRPMRGDPIGGLVRAGRLEPGCSAAADRRTKTEEEQPDGRRAECEAEDPDDGKMVETNRTLIYVVG